MPKNTFLEDLNNSTVSKPVMVKELRRKSVHLFAMIIPILYMIVPRRESLLILAVCAFISILLDLLKYYEKGFRRLFLRVAGNMLRRREFKRFTSSSYILCAALVSIVAFDRWVAVSVLTFIVLGDFAAAIFGRRFGKHKTVGNKTLEGSLAFFIAAYTGAIAFKLITGIDAPWPALFTGALTATVVEALPLGIDDNLTVPILTGVLLQLMYIGHF